MVWKQHHGEIRARKQHYRLELPMQEEEGTYIYTQLAPLEIVQICRDKDAKPQKWEFVAPLKGMNNLKFKGQEFGCQLKEVQRIVQLVLSFNRNLNSAKFQSSIFGIVVPGKPSSLQLSNPLFPLCAAVPRKRFHDVIVKNGLGLTVDCMAMSSAADCPADETNLTGVGFESEFYLLKSALREGKEEWFSFDLTPSCASAFDLCFRILHEVVVALILEYCS
ncbi:hypothetical protein LOK49_LG14G01394 [Camellia lanceoleosa]|uniref:Uncharacterized protein n=1 Tax=Camellia lanceoleosa TaxID=1840588 RepID=A0ACC0FA47_9ERIC|nr:hypothetical protein LOK49_LG14G01394 [Camellia lanceoleosa]